ncbi:MAG: ParA family protein, partial [Clostridia bacterium]|nr:ParA family protein [Clostridia bacterium]
MKKTKIIAFANQKGGVGKTTSAVNIAAGVAALGKKVLLCDFDPQGNATSGVGADKNAEKTVYDIIMGENPYEALVKTEFENLDCIPSSVSLAGAELEIADMPRRETLLKSALDMLRLDYDYIFIDCPPSLGLLTINAFCAADGVIVPMQCEYFALEGLSQLMRTLQLVKKKYNPKLSLDGIVVTMFDGRLNLSLQVLEEIKNFLPGKLFRTPVPRNVRLSEAPSYGMPIMYYDKHSKGALAYEDISKELIERF